jgi:Ala-tRNA(Pro) deacylase
MLSPQQLFDHLDRLGIACRTVEHPPVFTVEQAKALRGHLAGHHIKNLFLRNKKEEMWLVVALEDRAIDLTPLALINDRERLVRLALDRGLADGEPVNVHPLVNTMTTTVAAADLLRFFEATGHPPRWLDFPL